MNSVGQERTESAAGVAPCGFHRDDAGDLIEQDMRERLNLPFWRYDEDLGAYVGTVRGARFVLSRCGATNHYHLMGHPGFGFEADSDKAAGQRSLELLAFHLAGLADDLANLADGKPVEG